MDSGRKWSRAKMHINISYFYHLENMNIYLILKTRNKKQMINNII